MREKLSLVQVLALSFVLLWPIQSPADPAWWQSRGVLDTNSSVADYAPVVLGQLKWMATNAYDEVQSNYPAGAGADITALIAGFSNTSNYCPANVGQLKYVAKFFYDRLTPGSNYPWTASTTDDVDNAIATIGQLKNLFSFDLTTDADSDGLPDWWETIYWGSTTNQNGSGDADSDGLSNSNEYCYATSPVNPDMDNDGINDGTEVENRTDPTNSDTNAPVVEITVPEAGYIRMILP